ELYSVRCGALAVPADALDRAGDQRCTRERDEQRLPGAVLERLAAEVAEERRVRRPDEAGRDVERHEPAPRPAAAAGCEGDRRPPAGDEAPDDDQVAAALLQQPVEAVELL